MSSYEKLLMQQYSQHMHMITPICYITANAVAFGYEANMSNSNKSQRDIAREKAMAQAQTQCFMKGGDFVLSLSCEFSGDAEVCVCSFVGCVAQKREMVCAPIADADADRKEYDDIVDDIELAMESEFAFDSSESVTSSVENNIMDAYATLAQ